MKGFTELRPNINRGQPLFSFCRSFGKSHVKCCLMLVQKGSTAFSGWMELWILWNIYTFNYPPPTPSICGDTLNKLKLSSVTRWHCRKNVGFETISSPGGKSTHITTGEQTLTQHRRSIEWMPICSLLFHHICSPPPPLPPPAAVFFYFCDAKFPQIF